MSTPRAILIAGPTASGKSALAVAIAARHNGVVINADSMQVYSDLEILTARPGPQEMAMAPHALYGHVAGAEAYSVGRWIADIEEVLAALQKSGQLPVIVGGTGLYFKALLDGLSPIPQIPEAIRQHWRTAAASSGAAALHAILAVRDPETAARLRPTDPQRVTRALEVLDATGRSLTDWQREPGQPLLAAQDTIRLVLAPERDALYARAEQRLERMVEDGALHEVERLAATRYSPELPIMRALGVRPFISALAGTIPLGDAVAAAKSETRHYIKRQMTWHRRNMITWIDVMPQDSETIAQKDFTLIRHWHS